MRTESPNGEAERQVANDGCVAVLTSAKGKKWRRGKKSPAITAFYRGKRERGSGQVPLVGDKRWRQVARQFPLPPGL
jgi:hypothetical protein